MSGFTSHNMMIRIDGDKIKRLREQKGLTQLYVATVVQVTTDTISRWENKRYPTIKKDNGIRLAEALEVELGEILEQVAEEQADRVRTETAEETAIQNSKRRFRLKRPLLLSVMSIITILIAFISFVFLSHTVDITVHRYLPPHYTPGQPFPIALGTTNNSDKQVALIIKEVLAASLRLITTSPETPAPTNGDMTLRWIGKSGSQQYFIYIATIDQNRDAPIVFSGTFSFSKKGDNNLPIEGDTLIKKSTHHWADLDADNIISDTEILTVYERFGEIEVMRQEIDRIEEIWLGSGYRWNQKESGYDILP